MSKGHFRTSKPDEQIKQYEQPDKYELYLMAVNVLQRVCAAINCRLRSTHYTLTRLSDDWKQTTFFATLYDVFQYNISINSSDITEEEVSFLNALWVEIDRVIYSYRKYYEKEIKKLPPSLAGYITETIDMTAAIKADVMLHINDFIAERMPESMKNS
jgi:hypothetical protein